MKYGIAKAEECANGGGWALTSPSAIWSNAFFDKLSGASRKSVRKRRPFTVGYFMVSFALSSAMTSGGISAMCTIMPGTLPAAAPAQNAAKPNASP